MIDFILGFILGGGVASLLAWKLYARFNKDFIDSSGEW